MNKANVSNVVKGVRTTLSKNCPKILTGLGIGGMVTTTVLAVKATPKALILIEEKTRDKGTDKLTATETIKAAWKCYIPAIVTGSMSVACLLGANSVHTRRGAALATAYKLSETALAEYQEKVIETIGEKKEEAIRDKVAQSRIDKNPVSQNEVIVTSKGTTLCYDYYSGRYFESDIELVKKAINQLNSTLLRDDYVSLNELYDELGLGHTGTGEYIGWNINRVNRRELIQPRTSAMIADDGRPCIVISCDPEPKHEFMHYA